MSYKFAVPIAASLCILSGCAIFHGKESSMASQTMSSHEAMEKLGWRLGCQAYTFRSLSLFETIDVLRQMGIRYVEMYPGQRYSPARPDAKADHHMSQELIDELKKKLKDSGVTAVNYGVVIPDDEKDARAMFEFAKKMGIKTIVAEPPENMLEMLDRMCQEYDMNLAIHNHPQPPPDHPDRSHYWNVDTVVRVLKGRSTRVGACADIGHWYRSGLVPVECLKKLRGKIIDLHFKDINAAKEDVPWGTGACDIRGVMAELKAQGARPIFTIEYEHGSGQELIDNVKKSIEYFDQVAIDLAKEK
jgi:sugar phosphate isomerase/epimerase